MSEQVLGNFAGYRQMVNQVRDDLLKLKNFSEDQKLTQNASSIAEVLEKSANDTFQVAVIGEFKRGKSTLINALLEQDVLPTDAMPATATLNRVTYSIQPFARVEYKDGTTEDVEIEQLAEYVTKLTEESEQRAATVKMATVYYPTAYCKNNVDIIDTPGLNDDSTMAEVTMSVLPQIDAALFVIMAQSPFSEYERDFLENKLMTSDLGRILFVVTGIDRLDEDDVDRVLESISERINRYVIEKAKKLYGEDSKEFASYQQKLGNPKVFGLSAKQALKAKKKGDNELLEESRFPVFEQELERFLTEDRGAIAAQVQVNKILSAAEELVKAVKLRESAYAMGQEEFKEKYQAAQEEIAKIRAYREEEYQKIETSADETWKKLRPMSDGFWEQLTSQALAGVDAEPIGPEDVKKEKIQATKERILKKIQMESENQARLLSEKIQVKLTEELGREVERLSTFEENFFDQVSGISQSFYSEDEDKDKKEMLVDAAIGGGVGLLLGSGFSGIYAGWKQGGAKGALLGGAVGFGSAVGVSMVAGMLAIPVTLPIVLVASVVGALSSKYVVGKWIVGDAVDKFRKQLKETISAQYAQSALENDIHATIRSQIKEAFSGLKEKIDTETETVLQNLEATLADLDRQMIQKQALDEKEKEELQSMLGEVSQIVERTVKLGQQLTAVLER